MKLFESLVDYLEDELVRAGIKGVQFCINGESHHKRKLDLADDVILLIEHEDEIQPTLHRNQEFYPKHELFPNPSNCSRYYCFRSDEQLLEVRNYFDRTTLPRVRESVSSFFKNNQKGTRGCSRFGCAARLRQQLPLIIETNHIINP